MRTTIAGLCFTDAEGMGFSHDWRLVALSYLIAASGSFAALELAERLRRTRQDDGLWQTGSAVTLGGTIWSMHFLAMLAVRIDLPLGFSAWGTVLSFAIAVGGVAAGLSLARRGALTWMRLAGAGTVIGFAVACMHYVGMGALLFPGTIAYTPGLFAASVLVAIAAASAALWLALALRPDWRLRLAAALVMGVAICGMHFTGMAATVFQSDGSGRLVGGLATGPLATAVAGVTLALLGVALMAVASDRRLAVESERATTAVARSATEIEAIRKERALLDRNLTQIHSGAERERAIQGLLATVFLLVDTPVAILVQEGRFLMTNPSFDRLLGVRAGSLTGTMALQTVATEDRPLLAVALLKLGEATRTVSVALRLLLPDGSTPQMSMAAAVPIQPELARFRIVTFHAPAVSGSDKAAPPIDHVVAGKIRMVSLAEVRTMLGEDWPGMAERVMQGAAGVVRAHLGPNDTFRVTSDFGFVIAFANLSETDASARSVAIGQAIRRHLIAVGEDAPTVDVATSTAIVAGTAGNAGIDARFAQIDAAAPSRRTPVTVPGCSFEQVQGCARGQFIGYVVHAGGPANVPGLAPRAIDLQTRLLKAVVAQAQQAECVQSSELLFINLPYSALTAKAEADQLVAGLRQIDPEAASRLVIMLTDLPAGAPNSRVQDIVGRLSPGCHAVGFALTDMEPPGFDLGLFKSPFISIDAAGWGAAVPEARVTRLTLTLHLKRARLLVRHVASPQVGRQMRAAGVDYVTIQSEPPALALAS